MAKSRVFINRELSWLAFNQRVLEEACDPQNPLLERLKFLAIVSSNLDEFFMVRVGGLKLLVEEHKNRPGPAGYTPREQLAAISERAHRMVEQQYRLYGGTIEPALREAGILRLQPAALNDEQAAFVRQYVEGQVVPVLTPMPVTLDSQAPLPLLAQCMLYLAVRFVATAADAPARIAFVPLGPGRPRFITLPARSGYSYLLFEDMVRAAVGELLPGEAIAEVAAFRMTRNADIAARDDLAADMMVEMEEVISRRKRSGCVRLEIEDSAGPELRAFLCKALGVEEVDVYAVPGPLDLRPFMELAGMAGFDALKNDAWEPVASPDVDGTVSMFENVAARDILLYHPYESFDPVVRFVEQAADDPDVIAIKQILYRTSGKSPIVAALGRAARNGKVVTALVELKARFDEERNIDWARALEESGVQVIYGLRGLKSHAKVCIVVRREPQGTQRYVHFGTGNYNESTARIYSDVSLFTANEEFGRDATDFFNVITGFSQPRSFRKIESAPIGLRERIIALIDEEGERARQKRKAFIRAKMNSLAHPDVIEALCRASRAGVQIDLNVRGICALRPGVANRSENIRVTSVLDRYLEHARILHFHHGGENRLYISSADWMTRNLDKRVELMVPVEDEACRARLLGILDLHFRDTAKAWSLGPEGNWVRVREGKRRGALVQSQRALYEEAAGRARAARRRRPTVFEPLQAPETDA